MSYKPLTDKELSLLADVLCPTDRLSGESAMALVEMARRANRLAEAAAQVDKWMARFGTAPCSIEEHENLSKALASYLGA